MPVIARSLVDNSLFAAVAGDVLLAVGFAPTPTQWATASVSVAVVECRRDATWRAAIIEAWDRQCAFCGYNGQAGGVPIGLEAAHMRWFALDGPDTLDNGMALCMSTTSSSIAAFSGSTLTWPSLCHSASLLEHRTVETSTTCTVGP